MARPLWSGTIQISLIGFEVEIYPATVTKRAISFHEIDRNTLGRVHRQSISAGPAAPVDESGETEGTVEEERAEETLPETKTSLHIAPRSNVQAISPNDLENTPQHPVQKADIAKGYEYEKGKYAIVEPEELKNLRLAGKKTIEITQFAKSAEINPSLYDKPYFVLPKAGPQALAFAVVRQGMIDRGMVGIGEIVFSGRQHLMSLAPPHDPNQPGMMIYTLRFASELRDAHDFSKDVESIPIDPAQLNLANQLIDAWTRPFDVNTFRDQYEEALRDLVEAKIKHLPVPTAESEKKPGKVIDLMEALRQSIAQRNSSAAGGAIQETESETAKVSKKPPAAAEGKTKTAGATKRTSAKKPKSA